MDSTATVPGPRPKKHVEAASTRDVWDVNKAASEGSVVRMEDRERVIKYTGAELMRRTDTSPERCAQANREQADRREAMRRSGRADELYPVAA